mmetsp:Transcript_6411/g.11148  ORF Transcript_6411/g.11148 Transcript_6411/m.11148 type:complete len:202 (-) Transcript_6411:71-676(-)
MDGTIVHGDFAIITAVFNNVHKAHLLECHVVPEPKDDASTIEIVIGVWFVGFLNNQNIPLSDTIGTRVVCIGIPDVSSSTTAKAVSTTINVGTAQIGVTVIIVEGIIGCIVNTTLFIGGIPRPRSGYRLNLHPVRVPILLLVNIGRTGQDVTIPITLEIQCLATTTRHSTTTTLTTPRTMLLLCLITIMTFVVVVVLFVLV